MRRFALLVTIRLEPGSLDAFLPLIRANARGARETEPGCLQFDVSHVEDDPDTVVLYEVYRDAEAFEAHRETEHFRRFGREAEPLIRAKSAQRLWVLPPEG